QEYVTGPGGGYRKAFGDVQIVFWNRIGLQNTTGSDITITFDVPGHDDSLVILNEYGVNLAGTITGLSAGVATGSGTAFNTDFVGDDYVRLPTTGIDILRVTSTPGSPTSMNLSAQPPGFLA